MKYIYKVFEWEDPNRGWGRGKTKRIYVTNQRESRQDARHLFLKDDNERFECGVEEVDMKDFVIEYGKKKVEFDIYQKAFDELTKK
jgi:DNA-dependent RNA polymerase auxiliary subunit epsilon